MSRDPEALYGCAEYHGSDPRQVPCIDCGALAYVAPITLRLKEACDRALRSRNLTPLTFAEIVRCPSCTEAWRETEHRRAMRELREDQEMQRRFRDLRDALRDGGGGRSELNHVLATLPDGYAERSATVLAYWQAQLLDAVSGGGRRKGPRGAF